MRLAMALITAVATLAMPGAASAQDWIEYVDMDEHFSINFPGEPVVEDIEYAAETGQRPQDIYPVTARRYTAWQGENRYSLTVANYKQVEHVTTLKGAIANAAGNYRRLGEVTFDMYAHLDRMDGHQLQVTLPNGRRPFVGIHFNYPDRRLYIMEAEAPAGVPTPAHFQVSLQVLDDEGNPIRYEIDENGNAFLPQ